MSVQTRTEVRPDIAVGAFLRGVSQVVFQNNRLAGLLILAGVFAGSWRAGVCCALGTAVAMLAALLFGADRDAVAEGLYGFNGAIFGIALSVLAGDALDWRLWPYVVLGAAVTTILFAALNEALQPHRLPALTAPFVLMTWVFVAATAAAPKLAEAAVSGGYSWRTVVQGVPTGIGQIFLQDSWLAGLLILAGIAVSSTLAAGVALVGATVPVGVGMVLQASEPALRHGLYGFNGALVALALCGVFAAPSVRSAGAALLGVVVATLIFVAMTVALAPAGIPALTAPFVATTWLMVLARRQFN